MKTHFKRKNFSLIELVVVVAIMGALAALIIPSFSSTEKEAKESTDAYNSKGIVRYVHMFQNANDSFPSGFHTGLASDGTAPMALSEAFGVEDGKIEEGAPISIVDLSDADGAKYISSLKAAGINYLTAGEVSNAVATPLKDGKTSIKAIKLDPSNAMAGNLVFNGRKLSDWVKPAQFEMGAHADDGIIIALFGTSNGDWETVYSGGYHQHDDHGHFEVRKASKIALKNTPVSNVATSGFKYYACLFKLNNNGNAATLIGAVSPDMAAVE